MPSLHAGTLCACTCSHGQGVCGRRTSNTGSCSSEAIPFRSRGLAMLDQLHVHSLESRPQCTDSPVWEDHLHGELAFSRAGHIRTHGQSAKCPVMAVHAIAEWTEAAPCQTTTLEPGRCCTEEGADLNGLPVCTMPGQLLNEELMLCWLPAHVPATTLQRQQCCVSRVQQVYEVP